MKRIICGASALFFGIVALNAETIDNKSTQNNTIFKYNKRNFLQVFDENGNDVFDKTVIGDINKVPVILDDGHTDIELIDKGNGEIEVRKKSSPNDNK